MNLLHKYFLANRCGLLICVSTASCSLVPTITGTDAPPSIVVQPRDYSVSIGAEVTFRVSASSSSPAAFQWQWNQNDLLGATNSTLLLTNVQFPQVGGY